MTVAAMMDSLFIICTKYTEVQIRRKIVFRVTLVYLHQFQLMQHNNATWWLAEVVCTTSTAYPLTLLFVSDLGQQYFGLLAVTLSYVTSTVEPTSSIISSQIVNFLTHFLLQRLFQHPLFSISLIYSKLQYLNCISKC